MPGQPAITILLGPPRAGKTTRVLERYRALETADKHARRLLVLVPTALAVEAAEQGLMRAPDAPPVLLDAQILTFADLAKRILRHHEPDATRLTDLGQRLLLEDIVAGLLEAGAIDYYRRVAETPGFVGALADLFREFKQAEITPEGFEAELLARGEPSPKDCATHAIYAAYQRRLKDRHAYDAEGELWRVRDLLGDGKREPFADLRALFLDGFHSFTATQVAILPLLAAGVPEVVCTLPGDPDGRRSDLFHTVRRTIADLRDHFRVTVEPVEPAPGEGEPILVALADHIFDTEEGATAGLVRPCGRIRQHGRTRPAVAHGSDDSSARATGQRSGNDMPIGIIEAAGRKGEVTAIARRIKRLVAGGCRPDEIAVIVRSVDPYRAAVESVFGAYGIPFHTSAVASADTVPAVRFVLDCLDMAAGNWPWRRVAAVAKSSYAAALDLNGDDLDLALRSAGRMEGYDDHLQALERLASRLDDEIARHGDDPSADDDEREAPPTDPRRVRAAVQSALKALPRLADLVAGLTPHGTWPDRIKAIRDLVTRLRVVETACAETPGLAIARRRDDLLGLDRFAAVLDELAAVHAGGTADVPLADCAAQVRRALAATGLPGRGPREGAVAVLDAYEARTRRYPVVFVAGLLEGMFPRAHRDHPFYGEADRGRLGKAGFRLPQRADDQREEMFLFYMAVTRADRRLFITYPYVDEVGRETVLSSYLEDLGRVFGPAAPDCERFTPADVAPPWDSVADATDLRLRTVADLWGREDGQGGDAPFSREGLALLDEGQPTALRALLRGAAAERERESLRPPGPFDGVLHDPALVARVAARFAPDRPMSPTAFDRYRVCPFAFFLETLLGAEALPEPQEDFPPPDRGLLLHRVLARFYRSRGCEPVTAADRDAAVEAILEIADRQFRHTEETEVTPAAGLWRVHREDIRTTLRRFVEVEIEEGKTWRPADVEFAFGSGDAPCEVGDGRRTMRLRGRIDRIDRRADDPAAIRVLDYKSGANPPNPKKSLQLPLYVAAVRQVLGADDEAEAAYYPLRGDVGPRRTRTDWAERTDEAVRDALTILDDIRAGRFHPNPETDVDCPDYCQCQHLCRRDGRRIERKIEGHSAV